MRFHVISLPHTQLTKAYCSCAYTMKCRNFARMMMSLGHEVFLYGGYECDVEVTEHVPIMSRESHARYWPDQEYWRKEFYAIEWDTKIPYWQEANDTAIRELGRRLQPQDFICVIGGNCQQPIAQAFPSHMTVEFGIGYQGVFSKYRVFESYAWMHHIYGILHQGDGQNYDAVIPNYFDPADFPLTVEKDDYFLYIGRLVSRKGIALAVEATRQLGVKLKLAGQGVVSYEPGKLVTREFTIRADHLEYVGTVDIAERGRLMGRAKAVFAPTFYIGPFEGVSIEALFCGTPVITTDWGCFAENNIDGATGYRVRTLGEAVWAAQHVDRLLPPTSLRDYALRKFSLDVVRHRYDDYFKALTTLWGTGWYDLSYTGEDKRLHGGFS